MWREEWEGSTRLERAFQDGVSDTPRFLGLCCFAGFALTILLPRRAFLLGPCTVIEDTEAYKFVLNVRTNEYNKSRTPAR